MGKLTEVLKVAGKSNPSSVAGSIAKNIEEGKQVQLLAVGAGAVNQAVKAYAIARGYVAPSGRDLTLKVGFVDLEIDGEKKTGMTFTVIVD
jgi:stage V sporulation protein S